MTLELTVVYSVNKLAINMLTMYMILQLTVVYSVNRSDSYMILQLTVVYNL